MKFYEFSDLNLTDNSGMAPGFTRSTLFVVCLESIWYAACISGQHLKAIYI